jgi:hypothetical protein
MQCRDSQCRQHELGFLRILYKRMCEKLSFVGKAVKMLMDKFIYTLSEAKYDLPLQ